MGKATLLFFQVVLLAGYAMVDATSSRAGVRWVGRAQLILLVSGAIALMAARLFATAPGASEVTLGLALRLLAGDALAAQAQVRGIGAPWADRGGH